MSWKMLLVSVALRLLKHPAVVFSVCIVIVLGGLGAITAYVYFNWVNPKPATQQIVYVNPTAPSLSELLREMHLKNSPIFHCWVLSAEEHLKCAIAEAYRQGLIPSDQTPRPPLVVAAPPPTPKSGQPSPAKQRIETPKVANPTSSPVCIDSLVTPCWAPPSLGGDSGGHGGQTGSAFR